MRLRLSRLAIADLEEIYDFTLNDWGEAQAMRYISQLWDALEEIQVAPTRWRLRTDLHPQARVRICGVHLIIYRINDERVEISRILHGTRNLPDHIPTNFIETE